MARKSREEQEIPFVALLDTITNVVGILIVVLVTVGIAAATAVKKVLIDLPLVDEETLVELREQIILDQPVEDPEEVKKKIEQLEQTILRNDEELKTLDTSSTNVNLVQIQDLEKQIVERTKERDTKKVEIEQLLAELEKAKATLDQTPSVTPGPSSVVRMPNPRPFPENANITRVLVAEQGTILLKDSDYLRPILDSMERSKSQLTYSRDPDIAPFLPMLEKVLGSNAEAAKAWPDISGFAGTFQMDGVAAAWKVLQAEGLPANRQSLEMVGAISLVVRKPMSAVAEAIAAATKNDFSKWVALDPSTDPLKPTIQVVEEGGRVTLHWGSTTEQIRPDQRTVLGYFRGLADRDNFKNAVRARVIYDAFKIADLVNRMASGQVISRSFKLSTEVKPGSTVMQVKLEPASGETVEQMKQPNSNYVQTLRNIKADPSGVASFQIMPDAINTYLTARMIADEVGVPATWDFRSDLNVSLNLTGFEVQRFAPAPSAPAAAPPGIRITAPTRALD